MSEGYAVSNKTWGRVETENCWKIMVQGTQVLTVPIKSEWEITEVEYWRDNFTDEVDELVVTIKKKRSGENEEETE